AAILARTLPSCSMAYLNNTSASPSSKQSPLTTHPLTVRWNLGLKHWFHTSRQTNTSLDESHIILMVDPEANQETTAMGVMSINNLNTDPDGLELHEAGTKFLCLDIDFSTFWNSTFSMIHCEIQLQWSCTHCCKENPEVAKFQMTSAKLTQVSNLMNSLQPLTLLKFYDSKVSQLNWLARGDKP
ncbi:uncharacterized protein VP01_560g1, partial [Puccinia sorghi]